ITGCDLPGQPFPDRGSRRQIKVGAIVADTADIRIETQALVKRGDRGQFICQLFAHQNLARGTIQAIRKEFAIQRAASEDIEQGVLGFDGMESETTGRSESKVQVLKLVVLQIHTAKGKSSRSQVQTISNPASYGVGSDNRLTGSSITGVKRSKVHFNLVACSGTRRRATCIWGS